MPRCLVIAPCAFPAPRGSQLFIRGASEGLAEIGYEVTLACYGLGLGEAPDSIEIIRARSVPGLSLMSGPHPAKALANLSLARRIRTWCAGHQPDFVVGHNVEGPLVARLAGVRAPVLWEMHTRMAIELPDYVRGTAWFGARLDEAAVRASSAIVALSPAGEEWARQSGKPVCRLYPGIATDEVNGADGERARTRWSLDERPWVVYAGNADAYQDLGTLVDAMAMVPGAGLLMVVDRGHDLTRRAYQAGIPNERVRIVVSGRVEDHLDALAAASVAAIPRYALPGFPMKLLNHLALGVPTVAMGDAAVPLGGVHAAEGKGAMALACALREVLSHDPLREQLGQSARLAAEHLGWKARAHKMREFVEGLSRGV